MNLFKIIGSAVGVFLVLILGVFLSNVRESDVLGQATYQSQATTTIGTYCGENGRFSVIKTGPGTLANVVIVNESSGVINFYDGTTTTSHADHATKTITVIPASLAEGTYIYNVAFSRGLIADIPATATCMASSTITFE